MSMSQSEANEVADLKKRIVILETLVGDLHKRVDAVTDKKSATPSGEELAKRGPGRPRKQS